MTILPLLSQVQYAEWKEEEIAPLTKRIQNAGTEVVEAKQVAVLQHFLWLKRLHVLHVH